MAGRSRSHGPRRTSRRASERGEGKLGQGLVAFLAGARGEIGDDISGVALFDIWHEAVDPTAGLG